MIDIRSVRLAALLLLIGIVASPSPGEAQTPQEPRALEVDDLFGLERVADPQISPDGQQVAFSVTRTSLEDEASETRIWLASWAGGDARPLTGPGSSASRPRWSPDGSLLTFMTSRGDSAKTQVWALDRRGGEAWPLTAVAQGVSSYEWSPDGTRLALLIRDPDPQDSTRTAKDTRPPWVIDRLQFKRDGVGYLDRRRTHLFVWNRENADLTRLTTGDFDHSSPSWSPDGTRIAFVSNRTAEPDANANSDIWVVRADGSNEALVRVTSSPGSDGQPAWSPDGRWIVHTTVVEPEIIWYATRHLAIAAASGGDGRVLTLDLDRNVGSPRFSRDGRYVFVELEDSAERHLARVELDGDVVDRTVAGEISVRGFSMTGRGRTVVLASTPHAPPEVFAVEPDGLRPISRMNEGWLSGLRLGAVRNIHFESAPGVEVEGFVFTPPDYVEGKRYPTILRIHGGPVSQYDFGFNFEAQLFAANGYVVVTTNPRGSSGYGRDFSHALWQQWGVPDFQDVMAGVDYAIEAGFADPDRLGVGGWSYGGILTNYVITKTNRFKAAITGASEVLYVANYGHDHYQRQWEAELGLPWENRENWERLSPFNDVQNIVTPTLVMGGEQDWNVPIQNSEQLYQALKRLGRETELVVYPGQSHGIRTPSYQKDRYERYLSWYGRYLKAASVSDADHP